MRNTLTRQYNVTLTAAAEGFGLGSALAFGVGYMARNRPIIKRLPLAIRTSLVASSGVMLGVIYADKAGIDFEVSNNLPEPALQRPGCAYSTLPGHQA